MCYEFEQQYLRQRAEEARKALEDERRRKEQQPVKPERPKMPEQPGVRTPSQPDPVPV